MRRPGVSFSSAAPRSVTVRARFLCCADPPLSHEVGHEVETHQAEQLCELPPHPSTPGESAGLDAAGALSGLDA